MKKQGEITVFLSLSLLCVFALLCVMVEGARTAGSRYYFQIAVNGSLDTLFSQYHRELWKEYRILGLQYESEPDIMQRLEACVEKYLSVENWYPMGLECVDTEGCINLTDQGGDFFIQEVLDYMKYGIWDQLEIAPEAGEQFLKDIKEASAAGDMTQVYDGQEKEVQRLEDSVEQILNCVQKQEMYAENIRQALSEDDSGQFYKEAKKFRKEARKMENLLEKYEKRAGQLKQALSQGKHQMTDLQGEFQENRGQMFEEQMNPYAAYVEEDGRRCQELLHQQEISMRNLELLEETEELVERLEAEREYGDEEDEFSLGAAVYLWDNFQTAEQKLKVGKGDKEKQGFLDQIRSLAEGGLLQMVLPEGMEISKGSIKTKTLPSRFFNEKGEDKRNLPEQVLINEYCGKYFLHALSTEKREMQYETEYLLHGNGTDRENLEQTITKLFLIRQGLNMIYLLSDSGKREEARALAAVITGVTGLAPLVEIMACFILVVWAMGESIMDVRGLLSGEKVPLWKGRGDWSLSLDGLLAMGKEQCCPDNQERNQEGRGFTYETYLKLLLLMEDAGEKQMRMLDVIQINIQREEPGFCLNRCAYKLNIRGKAHGKHVFFAIPIVENFVRGEHGYPLEAAAEKAY